MTSYVLRVETEDAAEQTVILRLTAEDGEHRGSHVVRLRDHSAADWEGVFDTRGYVERYQGALLDEQALLSTAEKLLDRVGVFLGEAVLGREILAELYKSRQQRTLLVRLPDPEEDKLAAVFARVPWELARPAAGEPALMERALVVRVVTQDAEAGDSAVRRVPARIRESGEVVRVLAVFAEAPGSRPLAMRLERELLRELFENEILPHRRVQFDVLCHGVTREVLREQIEAAGGYHIVHWSGHGHHNRLELLGEDEGIRSDALVQLFAEVGFVPQLFFLSACHSGSLISKRDWALLQQSLREREDKPGADASSKDAGPVLGDVLDPKTSSGYTGTALELLRAGVLQVIAMRYAVGDDYARELSRWFYKRLLADRGKHTTEAALALARGDVLRVGSAAAKRSPVDHANPLVFGQAGRLLDPVAQPSEQIEALLPKPQPLLRSESRELDRPALFVGRGDELTQINRAWQPGGAAIAVVQGMAGLGKTALAAEAVHLWFGRFRYVLAFQAKPQALAVEEFLRQIDARLITESVAYHKRCEHNPRARVYIEPSSLLRGEARYQRMVDNLIETLRVEAVLLVLDNFETNLLPRGGGYECRDPHWEDFLRTLVRRLPGTRSRLLMTTRHRPAALAGADTLWLPLGPLPLDEAVLYARSHTGLATLWVDEDGRRVLTRMLKISRGHPIILRQLAALVGDRAALTAAMDRLTTDGFEALPDLSATLNAAEKEAERVYLEEVAIGSVDILLERLSVPARRLLWVVTLANEPVGEDTLAGVWADEQAPERPLLIELHDAGLLSRELLGDETAYGFHELVRERVDAWMDAHPDELGQWTAQRVWVGYGQRYAEAFKWLLASRKRTVAAEAGRRALIYLVRAGDFDGLYGFAGMLVTGTNDLTLLGNVIAELRAVAEQVPPGETRWRVRTYLADALNNTGQSDEALAFYKEAAREAEQAEHWANVAWICGNWAGALREVGQLDAAKANHLRSADAERKSGNPRQFVVASELEALRIDVMQGHAERALPDIEIRLTEIRAWWTAHTNGQSVSEAPDTEFLARALVGGLDVAQVANVALERWQACLELLEELEQLQNGLGTTELELAYTRFNRSGPLLSLGRLDEAQRVLESCLTVFRNAGDLPGESRVLGGLAVLWHRRGDSRQAADLERRALALRNRLPYPVGRAKSHHNLANYLGEHPDAAAHRLADIVYCFVCSHHQELSISLRNVAKATLGAISAGTTYELPRLADLLARPSFTTLQQFLVDRQVDLDALQTAIEQLVAQTDSPFAALPLRLQQLFASTFEAAQAGQNVEPLLAAIRSAFVEQSPEHEPEIDAFLTEIRSMLPSSSTTANEP